MVTREEHARHLPKRGPLGPPRDPAGTTAPHPVAPGSGSTMSVAPCTVVRYITPSTGRRPYELTRDTPR